jgi:hypothetical protein
VLPTIVFLFTVTVPIQSQQLAPSTQEAVKNAGILSSSEFNAIVSKVFSGAKFHANSCAGSDKDQKTSISIPDSYQNSKSLAQLSYKLSGGEISKSTHKARKAGGQKSKIRKLTHMRACIDNWNSYKWEGSIEKGKFIIKLPLGKRLIATKGLYYVMKGKDINKWHDPKARNWIPDYSFNNLALNVYLIPKYENGQISYGNVDVFWDNNEPYSPSYRVFKLIPLLPQKIEDYTNYNLELLRQTVVTAFNNSSVRNRLSKAITDDVTSSPHERQITSLSVEGSSLTVGIK